MVWIAPACRLTTPLRRAMMVSATREAVMRAQARAHEIPLDRVDLEALDQFLMSERSPPQSMMLSDLDGFLTGIAVGPELVLPSQWLPLVFGGDAPEFADEAEAKAILGAIMGRYLVPQEWEGDQRAEADAALQKYITPNTNFKCSALPVPFRCWISSTTRPRHRTWQAWAAFSFMRLFTSCAAKICSQSARAICTPSRIASAVSPSRARMSAKKDTIRASLMGVTVRLDPEYMPLFGSIHQLSVAAFYAASGRGGPSLIFYNHQFVVIQKWLVMPVALQAFCLQALANPIK